MFFVQNELCTFKKKEKNGVEVEAEAELGKNVRIYLKTGFTKKGN